MDFLGSQPKICFLMIGINDLSRQENVDNIFNNYIEIINILQSKKITPVIQSTLLTLDSPTINNTKVILLNKKLKEFAHNKSIDFIDLNKELAPNGALLKEYSSDGVHLNIKGYIIWKNNLAHYIQIHKF